MHPTPTTLLADQLAFLDAQVPGIRDGSVEAIHAGRVATRRVRELLPLCLPEASMGDEFHRTVRNVGRGLGRVRELDVEIALLGQLEQRVPRAGSLFALRRHAAEATKQAKLRKLLKRLPDRLSPRATFLLLRSPRQVLHDRVWPATWRATLREQLQSRREAAEGALGRAGGVYFPNRLHDARIALKKLRYSAELAVATGVAAFHPRVIRRIRKAQDALGDMHDWQLLLSALEDTSRPDDAAAETVVMLLRSDIQSKHRGFLDRRDELAAACHAIDTHRSTLTRGTTMPAATALAVAAVYAVGRARRKALTS
jgi:CHAD domain-containing protein